MVASGLKIKNAVSMKLQRALHDPSRGIRVLSSKTIGLKKNILKKKKNFAMRLRIFVP